MDKLKIGQFIANYRKRNHLTQEQLAEMLGISKNAVSKWERGICLMDLSLLKPLSEMLHVSVLDILSGEIVESNEVKEKAEENLIHLANYHHYQSVTKGTLFNVIFTSLLIIYSLIQGLPVFGYAAILFGFSATVYYNKYKLNKDSKLLFHCGCMLIAFIFSFIAFIVSTL